MNLCTMPLGSGCSVSFGGTTVPVPAAATNGQGVVLGLRPESLDLAPEGLPAKVEVVEEFGPDAYVFCVAELSGGTTKLIAKADARRAPQRGDRVALRPRPDEAHVFDPETGERLGR